MFRKTRILWLAAALFWLAAAPQGRAVVEAIAPPFGLKWGTTKERLEGLLKNANARIVERRTVGRRDQWTVEGLKQAHLKQGVFYFRNEGLTEVELQYQDAAWLEPQYSSLMSQMRTSLDQKYGTGRLIARSKTPQGNVTTAISGYEWVQAQNAVRLVYFSAESQAAVFRMVSLHYTEL
jgi:hypothetical protein